MDSHSAVFNCFRPFKGIGACAPALLLIPVLYWFAFRNVDAPAVLSAISRCGVSSLGALAVLNGLIVLAMCLRWGLILKRSGHRVPFSRLVSYRLGANAVSYLTPGPQFGGEPLQVHWLASSHGVPPDVAAASVVVDRIVELIANLCFLLLVGIVLLQGRAFQSLHQTRILGLIGLLCVMAVVLCRAMASGRAPVTRAARFAATRFGLAGRAVSVLQFVERGESQAASILNAPGRVLCLYGGCAAIQWLLMLSEFWFIYQVLGVSLSPLQLLALIGAARLAFLLPLPGALGALEAGQLVVLGTLNIDPVSGLAACLIMRARDLLLIGTGAVESIHRLLRSRSATPPDPLPNNQNHAQ